jgi:hypothetical protein
MGSPESYLRRKGRKADGAVTDLGAAAQLVGWPTTTGRDAIGSRRHGYMNDGKDRAAERPQRETLTGHAGTTLTDAALLAAWPTPAATELGNSLESYQAMTHLAQAAQMVTAPWRTPLDDDANNATRDSGFKSLVSQVRLAAEWVSPQAADAHGSGAHQHTASLCKQARTASWPTPNTPSGGRSVDPSQMSATGLTPDGRKHTVSLEHVAKFAGWPTPMAGTPGTATYSGTTDSDSARITRDLVQPSGPTVTGSPASTAKRGRLNAAHSRWLQGYPVVWCQTAIQASRRLKRRLKRG